jgi:hypothetical protein
VPITEPTCANIALLFVVLIPLLIVKYSFIMLIISLVLKVVVVHIATRQRRDGGRGEGRTVVAPFRARPFV